MNAEIRLWKSNLYPNVIHPPIKVFSGSIQTWGSLVSLQERYRDISRKLVDDSRTGIGRKGEGGGEVPIKLGYPVGWKSVKCK